MKKYQKYGKVTKLEPCQSGLTYLFAKEAGASKPLDGSNPSGSAFMQHTQKEKLKISLIIPAHNEEKYIGSCLEHAIKNSNGNFTEIIVVDNASSDKTSEIAKKYKNVKVVREDRKGTSLARDCGFRASSGEILAFIDADTHMPAGWSEIILEEFTKDKKLVCLSGPCFFHDVHIVHKHIIKFFYFVVPIFWPIVAGGNFAIRREALHQMDGFDTSITFYGDDTNITRRAKKIGKVKFNLKFKITTSGRRFGHQGFLKLSSVYILNFFSETLFHKIATKKYKDIR